MVLRPKIVLFLRRLEGQIRGLAENPSNIVSRVRLGLTLTLTLIRRDPVGALPVPVWIEDLGLWRALFGKISPITEKFTAGKKQFFYCRPKLAAYHLRWWGWAEEEQDEFIMASR